MTGLIPSPIETNFDSDRKSEISQDNDEFSKRVPKAELKGVFVACPNEMAEIEAQVELETKFQTAQTSDETSTVEAQAQESHELFAQKQDDIVKVCRNEMAEIEVQVKLETRSRTNQMHNETSTTVAILRKNQMAQKRNNIVKALLRRTRYLLRQLRLNKIPKKSFIIQ